MVNRDKYDAIMDEFFTRMDAAASAFESEMAEHRETLTELLEQHEKEQQREGLAGGREAANWNSADLGPAGHDTGPASQHPGRTGHNTSHSAGYSIGHSSGQKNNGAGWGVPPNLFD